MRIPAEEKETGKCTDKIVVEREEEKRLKKKETWNSVRSIMDSLTQADDVAPSATPSLAMSRCFRQCHYFAYR